MINFDAPAASLLLTFVAQKTGIDAERCGSSFRLLLKVDRLRRRLREALSNRKLSELQFAVLVLLLESEHKATPLAQLAVRAGVSRSATTEALDSLESMHLAHRIRDEKDRRIIRAEITVHGKIIAEGAMRDYLAILSEPSHAEP